jgi:YNFM family putative membrane transporter
MTATTLVTGAARRIDRAMLLCGFVSFGLLYCVQPLMPLFGRTFAIDPTQASLVLSISTMAMAVSLVAASLLSDRIGRTPLMIGAIAAGAVLTVLCAFARSYGELLALRALLGVALGGVPAVAMAYMGDEVDKSSLGASMGLYIAGSAFGGMFARVGASVLSDLLSWRAALFAMGVASLWGAFEFWRLLPASSNFRRQVSGPGTLATMREHLRDEGMPWLFAIGFLMMGAFVCLYNYAAYRLSAAPFAWSQSAVGALSVLYMVGMFSSVWAGRLADRIGRRNVLWIVMLVMMAGLLLTLSSMLVLVVAGMAVFTFGFFASHSVASSWIGLRARRAQALAAAMYLFFYYLGSSVIGSLAGAVWSGGGWNALVAVLAATLGAGLLIALRLRGLAPLAAPIHHCCTIGRV